MKSTIKLSRTAALIVTPCKTGGMVLEIQHRAEIGSAATFEALHLTADQAGALIVALEMAAEESGLLA